jgi:hypothetical protein
MFERLGTTRLALGIVPRLPMVVDVLCQRLSGNHIIGPFLFVSVRRHRRRTSSYAIER